MDAFSPWSWPKNEKIPGFRRFTAPIDFLNCFDIVEAKKKLFLFFRHTWWGRFCGRFQLTVPILRGFPNQFSFHKYRETPIQKLVSVIESSFLLTMKVLYYTFSKNIYLIGKNKLVSSLGAYAPKSKRFLQFRPVP